MEEIIEITAKFVRALRLVHTRKAAFLGLFVLVFSLSTLVLGVLDLLPNVPFTTTLATVSEELAQSSSSSLATTVLPVEEPIKIEIGRIGLATTIANPTTTNVAVLDELLLKGAVRYPTSAKLGEEGNVVLFGHSSYLPIVNNQAFKSFNGIQKLKQGDLITVYASGAVYTYAVRTVTKESADDAVIPLTGTGRVLTLATCNSFGEKSDRFVVTADLVESHSVGV